MSITKTCSIVGCNIKYRARGYCHRHYERLKKYGDPMGGQFFKDSRRTDPAYWCYWNMRKRCLNIKHPRYSEWGSRGITICARWLEPAGQGFKNFIADMGERPGNNFSIDRINNNGNYEPANCRWATREQQQANKGI